MANMSEQPKESTSSVVQNVAPDDTSNQMHHGWHWFDSFYEFGLVLGIQVKSEIDVMQQELAPIMEMANSMEEMGLLLGVATGSLPLPGGN